MLLGKAQRADPGCPVIYQALSQIYMAQGRFDAMLAAAEKALALGPSDAENWIVYSDALGTLGRYAEGIAAGERALRLNPLAPPYYPGIARLPALRRRALRRRRAAPDARTASAARATRPAPSSWPCPCSTSAASTRPRRRWRAPRRTSRTSTCATTSTPAPTSTRRSRAGSRSVRAHWNGRRSRAPSIRGWRRAWCRARCARGRSACRGGSSRQPPARRTA